MWYRLAQVEMNDEIKIFRKTPKLLRGYKCACGCGQICDDEDDVLVVNREPGGNIMHFKKKCFQFLAGED
jgi:hypothetical protein